MSVQAQARIKDDELIEWQFVSDYAEFALRMNFLAITTMLEKARAITDPTKRKSICLSGLQYLYGSYEDFAILLHAFRERINGRHLHLTIGVEDQNRRGSTTVPKILKHYESARQVLDNFGFTSVTYERLSRYLHITEGEFEDHYRDITNSIKGLGEYAGSINDYKNKLKHGKPVLEGEIDKKMPDHVLFLRWEEKGGAPVLELHWLTVTLEQLEKATIQVAKIYIRSLDFLWLFMLHYYPDRADKYLYETMVK
jgi:hypothetical protein